MGMGQHSAQKRRQSVEKSPRTSSAQRTVVPSKGIKSLEARHNHLIAIKTTFHRMHSGATDALMALTSTVQYDVARPELNAC